jgi:hypothetical protein
MSNRRDFGLQAMALAAAPSSILVPAGMTGIGVTALVLPGRAHAWAPIPFMLFGAFVAKALHEIFADHGLGENQLRNVARADARHASKPNDFDGMFADDVELNVSQAWRFDNGKIVGVNGAAYGGDPYAVRRASLNESELRALSHPDTTGGWGAMVPTSMRLPPDGNRQKVVVAYKDAHAEKQRTRTSRIADPLYVRRFEKMGDSTQVAGVFGRADDGALRVTWVNKSDIG